MGGLLPRGLITRKLPSLLQFPFGRAGNSLHYHWCRTGHRCTYACTGRTKSSSFGRGRSRIWCPAPAFWQAESPVGRRCRGAASPPAPSARPLPHTSPLRARPLCSLEGSLPLRGRSLPAVASAPGELRRDGGAVSPSTGFPRSNVFVERDGRDRLKG